MLRIHPMFILGGILQENPFHMPPVEFLREYRLQREGRTAVPSAGLA